MTTGGQGDFSKITKFMALSEELNSTPKYVKAYIDHSFQNVSASCEFFYTDEESMRHCIEQSLKILSLMRCVFRNAKKELSE